MKVFAIIVTALLVSLASKSQNFHVNLFAGASNYQGDLQDKRFTFSQSHLAGGVGLLYDLSDKVSVRSGITFGKVSANDRYGRNRMRNLNFTSNITDVNVGLEYYITRLQDHALTPYVFGGIALFHFNPYTTDTSGTKYFLKPLSTEGEGFADGRKNYSLTQFALPFGCGVKLSLSENINVGIELGLRKLFTDHLDDVSTNYVDQASLLANRGPKAVELAYRGNELKDGNPFYPDAGATRGSAKHKDWYYFTGLTASIRLAGKNQEGRGRFGKHTKYGCPAKVN
jgi:opacity protein-like surface antigen